MDNFVTREGLFEPDLSYLGQYYEIFFGEYKTDF